MRTVQVGLVVAFLLTSAMSAQAAEYQHLKGPTWRTGLIEFLTKFKPDPQNVTGGITSEGDVHVYLVPGQFTGTYQLLQFVRHPTDRPVGTIKALVDGGNARIFSFVGEDLYVLTWTKQ